MTTLVGTFAFAMFTNQAPAQEQNPPELEGDTMMDRTHESISRSVLDSANWLDSFFADERIENEENTSRLKFSVSPVIEDGQGFEFNARPSFRLRLPVFEDRFQLEISGEPEDDKTTLIKSPVEEATETFEGRDERNFSAALRYFLKATKDLNISMQTGLSSRDLTPVLFVGPRFRKTVPLKPWDFRFTQRLRWYTDDGFQSNTRVDLERPLRGPFFFRTSVSGSWLEREDGNFFYDLSFFLFQMISNSRSLAYEWSHFFEIDPYNRLEELRLRLRYRQRIWRKWLFYEVAPQATFPHDRDFRFTAGIAFKLEVLFGGKKALE